MMANRVESRVSHLGTERRPKNVSNSLGKSICDT